MSDRCEYCDMPFTPDSRCRYQQHVMAFACTQKHEWLRQRAYLTNDSEHQPQEPTP